MINKYVAMGLGALIALAPVAAVAQEQVAQAAPASRREGEARDHSHDEGIAQTPYPAPEPHRGAPRKGFSPSYAQDEHGSRRGSEELI